MKKKVIALLMLAVVMLAMLPGCAKAQDPISEPDTDVTTQTHVIGKYQKITYSFHMKKIDETNRGALYACLLSNDEEILNDADNYCTVNIGDVGSGAFKTHHHRGIGYYDRWITDKNPSEWKMEAPYTKMDEINEADVTITYIRSGKSLRVLADIDGERAWQGNGGVNHLRNKEVYLRLSSTNYLLTNVQYHDMGFTFVVPTFVYVILVILGIIAIFIIHTVAKMGEKKLYFVDAPIFCTFISTGFTLCILGLALMIFGRSHPEALNKMFFNYITVPLSSEGAWFWVPTVIFSVGIVGFGIAIFNLAIGIFNHVLQFLAAFGLGLLHTLWYYTLANIIIQSIDEIFSIIFIVVIAIVFNGIADNTVVKSYAVYSKNGYVGTVYTLEDKNDDNSKKGK